MQGSCPSLLQTSIYDWVFGIEYKLYVCLQVPNDARKRTQTWSLPWISFNKVGCVKSTLAEKVFKETGRSFKVTIFPHPKTISPPKHSDQPGKLCWRKVPPFKEARPVATRSLPFSVLAASSLEEARLALSVLSFRKKVKTILFRQAFNLDWF